MTVQITQPVATVTQPGVGEVAATSGRITLDEGWSPYAVGTVTVPIAGVDVAALDPRQDQRITVSLVDMHTPDPAPRLFDLGLRGRTIDHKARTVDLDLASDEALLFDTCRLATTADSGSRAYEGSVRGICDWALAQVPGVLRNLEPNPRALGTLTAAPYGSRYGWTRAFTITGAPAPGDLNAVARFTSTEAGTVAGRGVDSYGNPELAAPGTSGIWVEGPQVTPGETITISRYVRLGGTSRFGLRVRFHDGAGNWVSAFNFGPVATELLTNDWYRPSWTGVVPAGAKYFSVSMQNTGDTVAVGTIMDVTGLLTERTDVVRTWREQALLDGAWDADMTAQWDATNLLLNPNATTTVAEWSAAAACTIAWNGVAGVGGVPGSVQVTPTAPDSAIYVTAQPSNLVASPGDMFTASAYVLRAGAGTAQSRITLRYYDADNRVIAADKLGALFTITNSWSRISVTGVAPANTARVTAFITTYGLSTLWYADQAMLTEGPLLMDYFDGATADTTNYTYSWEGPANGSASLRVATPERHPDLFDWRPGQSLWDFLRPFLEAAGLRLFCDEQRDWRVIDPTGYTRNDVTVNAFQSAPALDGNATAGQDMISRDRTDWATGVVVTFRWRDQTGRSRESFDVAGTPGKVITIDRETPPIKGAAATILARIQARGASQDATTIGGGFEATPAAFTNVNLGDTPAQTGRVRRVSFDLSTGLIDFSTRDMEVAP